MSGLRYVDPQGRKWNLYAVEFDSPDGDFTVTLYAISHAHACLQLDALKETGRVVGQIESILDEPE